jgi:hypothetical protein
MAKVNKQVKNTKVKRAIKINPDIIKSSLEDLIDIVNQKTRSLQNEVDDVFYKINTLLGKEYIYREKFVITDDDQPHFINEIDELDYIHDTLIFKHSQLEVKLTNLKDYYKKLLQVEIKKLEVENTSLIKKLIKEVIRFREQNIYKGNDMCDAYLNVTNTYISLKNANKYYTDAYNDNREYNYNWGVCDYDNSY